MKTRFQIERSDVQEFWIGINGQLLGATITLRHAPTGIEVKGAIAQEHRTKSSRRNAQELLRVALMEQLTSAVAKQLRIPGR